LREDLAGRDFEALALRLMTDALPVTPNPESPDDPGEARRELRGLVDRMVVARLKEQQTEAIAAAGSDPSALQRYRELHARIMDLEAALART
jgi:DNA primase